jgi:hypothetical protein
MIFKLKSWEFFQTASGILSKNLNFQKTRKLFTNFLQNYVPNLKNYQLKKFKTKDKTFLRCKFL